MMNATESQKTIESLYLTAADLGYIGESISQLEHAIQCGELARGANADSEVIIAAFLHDVGHLIPATKSQLMGALGRKNHEGAGAEFLKDLGFSARVTELVNLHVTAKRYLVTKFDKYYSKLSPASRKTLEFQGGKLSDLEIKTFENNPLFNEALKIRAWDEEAKVLGPEKRDFSFFLGLMEEHLK